MGDCLAVPVALSNGYFGRPGNCKSMPGSSNLDNYPQHHPTQHFHASPVLLLGCGEGGLNTRGSQCPRSVQSIFLPITT